MSLTSAQILDIVVLVFVAGAAIIGAIRGFFKSIIGVAVIAGSIFIGYITAPMVTPSVVNFLYPRISDKLLEFASRRAIDFSDLTQEQTDTLLKSLMTPATKIACWVVIAIICMIVLGFLGTLIGKAIDQAKAIKSTDALLGAVLGFVTAFLICYLLVFGFVRVGMGDFLAEKFSGSIAYKILYSCVPKASGVIGIELPFVGEIDLKELFKGLNVKQ